MTLDERPSIVEHRALREAYADDPEGRAIALATEAEDRRLAHEDWLDRELCESPEAEAAKWAGIFRAAPSWMRDVIYAQDRG